ncbi:MAG: ATP-dependent helicase [Spirochaetaceae bacterium]|nr:ATP-dependent helicase [Spirochaetaceae bacterium]
MSNDAPGFARTRLTDMQRKAVDWDDGPLLVLAGPGSGKTEVLTCRIARLLDASRDQHFRILALTFTNKAAGEMAKRVADIVPGLEGRTQIGTFHGFCARVLRQHGVHLGVKPDFAIYSRTEDRRAVLTDALHRIRRRELHRTDIPYLPWIDRLKSRLVGPDQAHGCLVAFDGLSADTASDIARVYRRYDEELRQLGALDFDSLIFEAHRLFTIYPAIAKLYQRSYRYWLIDEFQDTNRAQYRLLRSMASDGFRELYAVADDDQTIYEWRGADVRRIKALVEDFSCSVVQLSTNFRCPSSVVEAANRLIVYNSSRMASKRLGTAVGASSSAPCGNHIRCREFHTDQEEIRGIVEEISQYDVRERSETVVLARNRTLLTAVYEALRDRRIPADMTQRRDDFVTPQFRWLVSCLDQIIRPMDRRNLELLVEAFNSFTEVRLECGSLVLRSEAEGALFLDAWIDAVRAAANGGPSQELVDVIASVAAGGFNRRAGVEPILACFEQDTSDDNLQEDLSAWRRISAEIRDAQNATTLDQFVDELHLRSKEPVPLRDAVSLMTIHGAKGGEFDTVYLIGLAEEVLPSFHSLRRGDGSSELEEERRQCFVAITRAKRRLILSHARHYRGWPKAPSRFLKEMGCLGD